MLAIIAPVALVFVDKLFLNGAVSDVLIINRLTNYSSFALFPLLMGLVFTVGFISLAIIKRRQRI